MSNVRPPTFALGLVATLTACQPPANQTTGVADAVRAADIAWEKAFSSKDLAGAVAFVESTGSILPPNAPIATGPAAVRALFDGFYALPALNLHWQATSAEAARSGDLAYSSGTYEMTFSSPSGKPLRDRGKYVTVWRKETDGSWKVVRDVFNSDLPVPGPVPK
jgi:ketosteroid isomerase-like protein